MYPRTVTQRSTLRIIFALVTYAALLPTPSVSLLVSGIAQSKGNALERKGEPRPDKPEGELPNLDGIQNESQVEREPLAPIHSTMRSRKSEGQPWDGRRVGDPDRPQDLDQANRTERGSAWSNIRLPDKRDVLMRRGV